MADAYLISACRTPIGKFLGTLSDVPATELGATVVREAVRRAGVKPEDVDEVILGNILSAGLGQAPARQAALKAGLPAEVAALTINKMCGSGMKATMLAHDLLTACATAATGASALSVISGACPAVPGRDGSEMIDCACGPPFAFTRKSAGFAESCAIQAQTPSRSRMTRPKWPPAVGPSSMSLRSFSYAIAKWPSSVGTGSVTVVFFSVERGLARCCEGEPFGQSARALDGPSPVRPATDRRLFAARETP